MFVPPTPERARPDRPPAAGLEAAPLPFAMDAVLAALGCGVLVQDGAGAVISANPEAERLLGVAAARLRGRVPLGALWIAADEDGRSVAEADAPPMQALRTGRPVLGRVLAFGAENERRWAQVDATPLVDAHGRVSGVVTTLTDVGERRALRQQVEKLARLEPARMLGEMARGVAHDLNQRLTLVAGHAETARRLAAAPRPRVKALREALDSIASSAHEGAIALRRLQTFGRPGAEATEPIALGDLLRGVSELTQPRWWDMPRREGRRIQLVVEAAADATIRGVRGELEELFTNLIFNAVDAMPNGGTINVVARRAGATVEVDVTDTGLGIPPELHARVFESFFTTRGEVGTGLGLPSVLRTVERHGGSLELRSGAGMGATFILTFPAETAAPTAAARMALPPPGLEIAEPPPASAPTNPAGEPFRVLIVDDEVRVAELAARILRADGYDVTIRHSSSDALAILHRRRFDVLVVDLAVDAGGPSWALIDEVRARLPRLPVVLVTGWAASLPPGQAEGHGVRSVLAKPFRRAKLEAAVREAALLGAAPAQRRRERC